MKKPKKPKGKYHKMSCGNGGGCSKDLFTLPFCGGKRVYPRRVRPLGQVRVKAVVDSLSHIPDLDAFAKAFNAYNPTA